MGSQGPTAKGQERLDDRRIFDDRRHRPQPLLGAKGPEPSEHAAVTLAQPRHLRIYLDMYYYQDKG